MRKNPVFAVTAAATLALGIGATTAIFSVADTVLLRPLPYPDPDRLVSALRDMPQRGVQDFPFSNADFFDLRNGTQLMFVDMAAIDVTPGLAVVQRNDGMPEQIHYASVTPNFLRLLGARMALGRNFEDSDGQPQPPSPAPGSTEAANSQRLPLIALLSYEYWQRRYGGSQSVLNHEIPGAGARIVGVLDRGFELLLPPRLGLERTPDVWFALRLGYDNARRLQAHLRIIGKLRDRVSIQQAQSAADVVAADLRKNFAIKANAGERIRLEPMRQYLVAEVRPALMALMGAVIFLLLIAGANVANLWLVQASLRERELAVRAALGGTFWRLLRQHLAEAILLSGLGTLGGMILAWLGIDELLAIAPANLPRLGGIHIDARVLAFAATVGAGSAVVFGLAPAIRIGQPVLMQVLRASGRTAGPFAGRFVRNSVVVAEVALTFILLIGSGLMFRTFLALQRVDLGYEPSGLLTFQLLAERNRSAPERAALMRAILDHLRSLPWVRGVAGARMLPLNGVFYAARWSKEQELASVSQIQASADLQIVLQGYFEALRTPLLAGRTFTEEDNAPERNVAIIDQNFAAKAFPFQSAVGKRIQILVRKTEPEWVEIIGVVAHQRNTSLAEQGRDQLFLTDGYIGHEFIPQWAIRTAGNPAQYAAALRADLARFNPRLVLTQVAPMETFVERAQAGTRFSLVLIGTFSMVALLLAAVGLYGVLSTIVRQRTAEIGVRMALGADPGRIFRLMVGHGMRLSAVGFAIGVLGALALTRTIASMLVGVQPADPFTFAAMAAVFLIVAFLASWLPARRAARLDPASALREE